MTQGDRLSHSAEFNPFRYMYTEQPVATMPYITSPASSSIVPSARSPFPAHHNSPTHYDVPQDLTSPFTSQAPNEFSPFAHRWAPPRSPPHMCLSIPPPWEGTMPAESSGQSHPIAVHPAQSSWSSLAGALGPPPPQVAQLPPPPPPPPPSSSSAVAAGTNGTRRPARRGTIRQLNPTVKPRHRVQCPECGKTVLRGGLARHLTSKGHTNFRPYLCPKCGTVQEASRPDARAKHLKRCSRALVPAGGCIVDTVVSLDHPYSTPSPPTTGQPGTLIPAPAVSNSETDMEGQSSCGELEYPNSMY